MSNIHTLRKDMLCIPIWWIISFAKNPQLNWFSTSINMHWKHRTITIVCTKDLLQLYENYIVDKNHSIVINFMLINHHQKQFCIINILKIRCEISWRVKHYLSKITTPAYNDVTYLRRLYLSLDDIHRSIIIIRH